MKILIIEDERAIARQLKRKLLAVDPSIEVTDMLSSVAEVRDYFTVARDVDLIMTDIRLGDGVVFDALSAIDLPAHVVFVTAYDEYAVKAFKFNGIDYILKPPSADDLAAALARARSLAVAPVGRAVEFAAEPNPARYRRRFLCGGGAAHRVVNVEQVACMCVTMGKSVMVEFDGSVTALGESLDRIETELDPAMFFRANRRYIINLKAIESVHVMWNRKLRVVLRGIPGFVGDDIIISREKLTAFRRAINQS